MMKLFNRLFNKSIDDQIRLKLTCLEYARKDGYMDDSAITVATKYLNWVKTTN